MKKSGFIKSFVAVTIIFTHLMVSGGLIMIIHSCSTHHTKNVTTFSLISPGDEKENCCGTEEHESSDSHIKTGCCEYDISGFNLSSFIAASFYQDHDFQSVTDIYTCNPVTPEPVFQTARNVTFFNKHGGRFIVNANCQILS